MTSQGDDTALTNDLNRLRSAIIADIKRHVQLLHQSGTAFYGYAVVPPSYYTESNPATLVVAYNCETDIEDENCDDIYYRYSVDEWENHIHHGFNATNEQLKTLLSSIRIPQADPEDYLLDEKLIASVYQTILEALLSLRDDNTFVDISYLVIWLSGYQIRTTTLWIALQNCLILPKYIPTMNRNLAMNKLTWPSNRLQNL